MRLIVKITIVKNSVGQTWAMRGPQVGHGKCCWHPLTIGLIRAKLLFDYQSSLKILAHKSKLIAINLWLVRWRGSQNALNTAWMLTMLLAIT
jgi:hypothetical protein